MQRILIFTNRISTTQYGDHLLQTLMGMLKVPLDVEAILNSTVLDVETTSESVRFQIIQHDPALFKRSRHRYRGSSVQRVYL